MSCFLRKFLILSLQGLLVLGGGPSFSKDEEAIEKCSEARAAIDKHCIDGGIADKLTGDILPWAGGSLLAVGHSDAETGFRNASKFAMGSGAIGGSIATNCLIRIKRCKSLCTQAAIGDVTEKGNMPGTTNETGCVGTKCQKCETVKGVKKKLLSPTNGYKITNAESLVTFFESRDENTELGEDCKKRVDAVKNYMDCDNPAFRKYVTDNYAHMASSTLAALIYDKTADDIANEDDKKPIKVDSTESVADLDKKSGSGVDTLNPSGSLAGQDIGEGDVDVTLGPEDPSDDGGEGGENEETPSVASFQPNSGPQGSSGRGGDLPSDSLNGEAGNGKKKARRLASKDYDWNGGASGSSSGVSLGGGYRGYESGAYLGRGGKKRLAQSHKKNKKGHVASLKAGKGTKSIFDKASRVIQKFCLKNGPCL